MTGDMAKRGAIFQAFENQARHGGGHANEGGQRRRGGHWRDLDDRGDVGAAAQQLACHLEVERAVSGQENALAGEAPIASPQGLRRTGGHHARQGPTRHRRHPFIGAGGDDQPLGIEAANACRPQCRSAPPAEGAPDFDTGPDVDAETARLVEQARSLLMLGVGRRRPAFLDRDLLEILAARHRALVEHRHAGAGKARGNRCGKARRPAANDQDLEPLLGNGVDKFRLGSGFGARQNAPEDLAADRHRPIELGHAGALARPAIDLDQAVLADPHAAEDPPRRSGPVRRKSRMPAAVSAAARLSPYRPSSGAPSKVNWIRPLMRDRRHWSIVQ